MEQTNLDFKLKAYSIEDEPFSVYGVFLENGKYRRLPEKIARSVSEGVYELHVNTAGGRVKFVTDSRVIAIKAKMCSLGKMPHFPLTGSAGFDLYTGAQEEYYGTFVPHFEISDGYESELHFQTGELREITINFPLYSGVESLWIGLEEQAMLRKTSGYQYTRPMVFYGSSITQGGCASRPGMSYESIVSRTLRTDYVNLGFSGNARAEEEIAEYIGNLNMSVFVYDYDHNAPNLAHLEKTHSRMFRQIREKNPDLPVVMLSRPKYRLTREEEARLAVIRKTYEDALRAGDRNVYLIEGPELMRYAENEGTVDNCHPNDLGFWSMAKVLIPQLRKCLTGENCVYDA